MARIEPIPRDEMTPEQIRVNDAISARRGGGQAHGPFGIWLRTPALAEKAMVLGDHLRAELALPQRLQEIAVLTVARHWTAQYEWFAHARHAERLNVPAELIEAIRAGRAPSIADARDAMVYRLTSEMLESRALSDATYRDAVGLFGEQTVVDLITTVGFYVMVAVVLVGFRVDIPGNPAAPLPELTQQGEGAT